MLNGTRWVFYEQKTYQIILYHSEKLRGKKRKKNCLTKYIYIKEQANGQKYLCQIETTDNSATYKIILKTGITLQIKK